jgi:hypothetical protein
MLELQDAGLMTLTIGGSPITGVGLEHLSKTRNLRDLNINGTMIKPDEYALLTSIPGLRELFLGGDAALPSPESWDALASIATLDSLFISSWNDFGDAEMAQLANCKQVTQLNLSRLGVTDDGLTELHRMRALRRVILRESAVTADGVAALRKALPRCEVTLIANENEEEPSDEAK